jgi:flavin-dependent dehydrogenase
MAIDPKLKDGSSVAVIGAGPAGCLFASALQKLSVEMGIGLDTVIFDGKDFLQKGPIGCGFCDGIIPESLVDRLSLLGVPVPGEKVVTRYGHMVLHSRFGASRISHPDSRRRILTVKRSSRPRSSRIRGRQSFDDFLLESAESSGARVIKQPVEQVTLLSRPQREVKVTHGIGDSPEEARFDLVVGAFGMSRGTAGQIERLGFGYRAPATRVSFQAQLNMSRQLMDEFYQGGIHILGPGLSELVPYAEFIPGETAVTIGGRSDGGFSRSRFFEFLQEARSLGLVPSDYLADSDCCFCTRRVPVAPARNPYSDRLVIVGDAAYSRFRGDGISSALTTAELAARTALTKGLDATCFEESYVAEAQSLIVRDNGYGKAVHALNSLFSTNAVMGRGQKKLLEDSRDGGAAGKLRTLLWDLYTGESRYKALLARFVAPDLIMSRISPTLGRSGP